MKAYFQSPPQLRRPQQGSVLVPVLVIAILIVLVLMWQAGMFSGATSAPAADKNSVAPATQQAETNTPDSETPAAPATKPIEPSEPLSPRALAAQKIEQKAAAFKPQIPRTTKLGEMNSKPGLSEAETQAAIDKVAAVLIANNPPNLNVCQSAGDAEQNLTCAAAEQSKALRSAFAELNKMREDGGNFETNNGAAIMQIVVEHLQSTVAPFAEAVDR